MKNGLQNHRGEIEMKMIKKIKIGYKDYEIAPMNAHQLGSTGHYASIDHRACSIIYDNSVDDAEIVDSIIHEVLHGIYRQFGKDITMEEQEYFVGLFSSGLTVVFRDNPELLVLIQEAFKIKETDFREFLKSVDD